MRILHIDSSDKAKKKAQISKSKLKIMIVSYGTYNTVLYSYPHYKSDFNVKTYRLSKDVDTKIPRYQMIQKISVNFQVHKKITRKVSATLS
jgi:hypothetical protein